MPSPKSGKAGSAVAPADPEEAKAADEATPGKVTSAKAAAGKIKAGKHTPTKVKPHKPPETKEEKEKKTSWIEIKLVDEEDKPVPGEKYQVTLPDGETVAEGTLDDKGFARIASIEPGTCKVTFPELDKDAWKAA